MLKKWKPFWSYDIEKTEKWLSEMAEKGYRLNGVNKITRLFSFQNGREEEVNYHIAYDKHQQPMASVLSEAGWENGAITGNWTFLENRQSQINLFPAHDGLIKRNRLHALIWKIISIYYGIQLIMPLSFLLIILTTGGDVAIEPSPFWILTFFYFLQVIGVMILTVVMTRKLHNFERKYYDMEMDVNKVTERTFAKWKPNWMMTPDLTEKWLEEMALQGNLLVKVQGPRYVFQKGRPQKVSYALDFQWKTSPAYIEIHKSAGWKFMHTSAHSFLKTTIWAKAYAKDGEKPQLTYDSAESKAQKRKVIAAHGGSMILMFLLIGFVLWNLSKSTVYAHWPSYYTFILTMLIAAIFLHLYNFMKFIRYVIRSKP